MSSLDVTGTPLIDRTMSPAPMPCVGLSGGTSGIFVNFTPCETPCASTSGFVRQVTMNVLRAFADGPAAARYPAHDNLDAIGEYAGDPIGNPGALQ